MEFLPKPLKKSIIMLIVFCIIFSFGCVYAFAEAKDDSNTVEGQIYDKPYNVKVSEDGILTWEFEKYETYLGYDRINSWYFSVSIGDRESDLLDYTSRSFDLNHFIDDLAAQGFVDSQINEVSVKAVVLAMIDYGDDSESYYGCLGSQSIQYEYKSPFIGFDQMTIENISISDDQIISWDEIPEAASYEVLINNKDLAISGSNRLDFNECINEFRIFTGDYENRTSEHAVKIFAKNSDDITIASSDDFSFTYKKNKVSEVSFTSNFSEVCQLGNEIEWPGFKIEQPRLVPSFSGWYKMEKGEWIKKSDVFTAGDWMFKGSIKCEGFTDYFDKSVALTIDGSFFGEVSPNLGYICEKEDAHEEYYEEYTLVDFTSPVIRIGQSIDDVVVTGIAPKATYTGRKITFEDMEVRLGDMTLTENVDYKVHYSNNKKVGTAKITIKGTGFYTGTVTKTFKIVPKGTSISKITSSKKVLTVKWKKQSKRMSSKRITGYQIQIATNSKFTKNKRSFTVKGYKKTSKKIKCPKGKKKYYVRIRTYRTINGKKFYSDWSELKSKKIK